MSCVFSNDKPIFLQLADMIKSDIISGKMKASDKLESVRELAFKYSINPNTVQKSLQVLENEGLIITDRTNGKFIADNIKQIATERKKTIDYEIRLFINKMQGFGLSLKEIKEQINNLGE